MSVSRTNDYAINIVLEFKNLVISNIHTKIVRVLVYS